MHSYLFVVGYGILPNFSLDKDNFEKVSGIVSSVKQETYEERRPKDYLFQNIIRERIIVTIADRDYKEYYVSDIYEDHWPQLLGYDVVGKEVVLYLGIGKESEDPFRMEIDGEVIYDTDIRYGRNSLIILFTLALSLFNLYNCFQSKIETSAIGVSVRNIKISILVRIKKQFHSIGKIFLE